MKTCGEATFTIRKDRPTTWGDIERFVSINRLPFTVIRFNMSLEGCLIDTLTGDLLASTVKEATTQLKAAREGK